MKFIKLHRINTAPKTDDCIEVLGQTSFDVSTIDAITSDTSYNFKEVSVSNPHQFVLPTIDESTHYASLIKKKKLSGETEYITVYESVSYITNVLNQI